MLPCLLVFTEAPVRPICEGAGRRGSCWLCTEIQRGRSHLPGGLSPSWVLPAEHHRSLPGNTSRCLHKADREFVSKSLPDSPLCRVCWCGCFNVFLMSTALLRRMVLTLLSAISASAGLLLSYFFNRSQYLIFVSHCCF